MDKGVYRIIDANLNRVMEGIRVGEDIIRFSSDNERLTRRLKNLRHNVFHAVKDLHKKHLKELFSSRDIDDVGRKSIESEKDRGNLVDLFLANTQRGKEQLPRPEVKVFFELDVTQKHPSSDFLSLNRLKVGIGFFLDS